MSLASPPERPVGPDFDLAHCTRCGAAFGCGVRASQPCWCVALPPLARIDPASAGCLCPACLGKALAGQEPAN